MDKDNMDGFDLDLDQDDIPCNRDCCSLKKGGKANYDVGYGRPPKNKQFPKGKSGNPKGRPKHPVTFQDTLNRKMATLVTVTENGVKKKKTTLEVMVQRYINQALIGNDKLLALFIKENAQDVRIEGILYPPETKEFSPEEQARSEELQELVLKLLAERYNGQ